LSSDFITLYLAIELQSLGFYVLAALSKSSEYSAEAGIKYFVLGALSSGFLLLAFVLFYCSVGAIYFECIERSNSLSPNLITLFGTLFFTIVLLFKLGSFPFHQWLCDVYEGVVLNTTAFFSTVPKAMLLSLLLKSSFVVVIAKYNSIGLLMMTSGLWSICFASTAALYQKRLKRLISYSTISHTGFLLIGAACFNADAIKACSIYITLYIMTTLGLFSILFVSAMHNKQQKHLVN
jgi:NADH-quinone oxidoreductase subunit N